jgi:hypothetical protein
MAKALWIHVSLLSLLSSSEAKTTYVQYGTAITDKKCENDKKKIFKVIVGKTRFAYRNSFKVVELVKL